MAIGIDPTVDYAFKRLLASPGHPAVTVHFVNAVLVDGPRITKVELLNPFVLKESLEGKVVILDVRGLDEFGRWLNIEMQTTLPAELPERLTFYGCSLYVSQLGRGEGYSSLAPAISICVVTKSLFPESDGLHLDFRLRDRDRQLPLTNGLQIHLVQLPKYNVPITASRSELNAATSLEKWVYFFRYAAELTTEQIAEKLTDPVFVEAAGILEMIARTPQEREDYEARLKLARDEESRLRGARAQGIEEGRAEGRAEGRVQGELMGKVQLLQELLGGPVTDRVELLQLGVDRLETLAAKLQSELRNRP